MAGSLPRAVVTAQPDYGMYKRGRSCAAWLEGRVGDAADMPKLKHDMATGDVNRLGHAFPALDLLSAVNSGGGDVALALWCDLGRFRDDKAGAGALRIVEGVQLRWHIAGSRTTTRQWRHDDTIVKLQRPNLDRAKEVGNVIRPEFLH